MTPPRRWIRLDIGWEKSDWLADIEVPSRYCWVLLLGYTKAFGVCGCVKAMTSKGAAREFGVSEESFLAMLDAAVRDGAVVTDGETWMITAWDLYQNEGAAERQRRHRKDRSRLSTLRDVTDSHGVSRPVTDSSAQTLTLTVTETPKATTKQKRAVRRVIDYTPAFQELWKIRPRGPKPEAFDAYQAAIKKATHEQMTYALGRYVREQLRPGFDGLHLHRWLEGERWEEYANGNGPHVKHQFHDLGGVGYGS